MANALELLQAALANIQAKLEKQTVITQLNAAQDVGQLEACVVRMQSISVLTILDDAQVKQAVQDAVNRVKP